LKIVSVTKMPEKYFDICEARRCQKGAKHIVIIQTKNREGNNVADEYSFCDAHLKHFKKDIEAIPKGYRGYSESVI